MVMIKNKIHRLSDGSFDMSGWLEAIKIQYNLTDITILQKACEFTQQSTHGLTTFYGQPYLEHGLDTAEVLLDLHLDLDTVAASVISSAPTLNKSLEVTLKQELGETISKLVMGVKKMEIIPALQKQQRDLSQIDKIRKMLLAMATDIRVVIIKLAERLCFMRGIKSIPENERKHYAQEILDIYAPLANRLGIGQLKWELEDLAFRYLDPITYKTIANFLAERRVDREKRIQALIACIKDHLAAVNIHADVTGRAKHIYSIYAKASRKNQGYQEIYDQNAVRILVPNIEDCYTALSIVHHLWSPIIEEFDDYIAHPKPNGYRSIHTAVMGDDGKHFEIQIRTFTMHDEAERGVAAHWMYKEKDKGTPVNDATKIAYLRQLLDWHKEITPAAPAEKQNTLEEEQIYVITPAGDIIDLPTGATPLDFAYHVHTELGHRCRGAKINKQIVPLTHTLHTGDKVEITTVLQGTPSRDWLNPELGYIKTSRARSKILHWFKQQDLNQDIAAGRQVLDRELARHGINQSIALNTIARHFDLKNEEALLIALGRGHVRMGQILQALQPKPAEKNPGLPSHVFTQDKSIKDHGGTAIIGASDLLTRYAKCCKPIPGDPIIGYITQGRGISIHKKTCPNARNFSDARRFIQINWNTNNTGTFNTDLKIVAHDKQNILHDVTSLLANEKISLLHLNSNFNNSQNKIYISLTVKIENIHQLSALVHRLQQLPGIIEVTRVKS